jgi:hypothetical protein
MITTFPHPETRPSTATAQAGARLGRLAVVTCGLLALVAASPAAFARPVPRQEDPGPLPSRHERRPPST